MGGPKVIDVGDVVYPYFVPAQLGVVRKVLYLGSGPTFEIEWFKGKNAGVTTRTRHVSSYEALVETTERKAAKHRKALEDVKLKAGV